MHLDLRLAANGVTTRQLSSCCGESTTKQLSFTVRPVSTPPPSSRPLPSRALTLTVKKSDVRDLPLPPSGRRIRRPRHQVVDLAELRRRDIVEAADLVAAAAGQPRIDRRRDAVRLIVRRGHRQVVGDAGVERASNSR